MSTILDMPDSKFRTADLRLSISQQATMSGYAGSRQVSTNPWHGRWSVKADHVAIVDEVNIQPWRAFFANLDGQTNRFRFPVTQSDQHSGSVTAVVLSSSGSTNLVVSGLTPSVTYLPAGAFLTVRLTGGEEQLVQLKAALTTDGSGHASASFAPPLRGTPTASSAIETKNPWMVVALDTPETGWIAAPGQQYTFTIAATEAW